MIPFTATPRPLRVGVALLGAAGTFALAGCGTNSSDAPAPAASADASAGSVGSVYADGSYSATGSYTTPETVETIEVSITLDGGVITAVEVSGDPQAAETEDYQSRFIGGISDEVVGESLDDISVDRVAGSSLTSGGFNDAIEKIKGEAAA